MGARLAQYFQLGNEGLEELIIRRQAEIATERLRSNRIPCITNSSARKFPPYNVGKLIDFLCGTGLQNFAPPIQLTSVRRPGTATCCGAEITFAIVATP